MKLPPSLGHLFKNYVLDSIDDVKHRKLIIETVLAYGNWEETMWLFRHYGRDTVGEVFLEDYHGLRSLPEATRKLWELLFVENPLPEDADPVAKWRCRRIPPGSSPPFD